MSQIVFISNGQKTLKCSQGQLEAFTSQMDGNGKPVWKVVDDPNPPKMTPAELQAHDHTGQIAIVHKETGKEAWCEKGQLEVMLKTGWKKMVPDKDGAINADPSNKGEDPGAESANESNEGEGEGNEANDAPQEGADGEPTLADTLKSLDPENDKLWKQNGEINITSLREVVPNITRAEVEAAVPGFNREMLRK